MTAPRAVAVTWTGDATVSPFEGEFTLTLCASAAVTRIIPVAAQRRTCFKRPAEKLSEDRRERTFCKTNLRVRIGEWPQKEKAGAAHSGFLLGISVQNTGISLLTQNRKFIWGLLRCAMQWSDRDWTPQNSTV